jgi:hypothetical protein
MPRTPLVFPTVKRLLGQMSHLKDQEMLTSLLRRSSTMCRKEPGAAERLDKSLVNEVRVR